MKVLAISEERRNLEELRRLATGLDLVTELEFHEAALSQLQTLPVKGEVEVLLLDCRHGGTAPLGDLERLMALYPALNTVLIVDHESPDLLLRALRLGVREVCKAPISRDELSAALMRIFQKDRSNRRSLGQVMAFMACKGGSGASFLATNLGYALAAGSGKQVILIDLNIQFGDAVLYVADRRPSVTLPDVAREIQHMDMGFLKSALIEVLPNFGVLAAPEDPTLAIDLRPAQIEALIRFARANFDYVVLDLGRTLDTCSIKALDLSDQVYPVLQLSLPFLRDAKRLFSVYQSLEYGHEKLRPILNRVERSAGEVTESDANRLLGCKMYASIPNHYKSVTASVNQGIPIMKLDPASPVARGIAELLARITEQPAARPAGLLARIFARA